MLPTKHTWRYIEKLNVWQKMSTSKSEPEQAGLAILIYDKIEFKGKINNVYW